MEFVLLICTNIFSYISDSSWTFYWLSLMQAESLAKKSCKFFRLILLSVVSDF